MKQLKVLVIGFALALFFSSAAWAGETHGACQQERTAATTSSYSWLPNESEDHSILRRISVPRGYERIEVKEGSFAHWLRNLPLKKGKPPVYLYNGKLKTNQDAHEAVANIDVGDRDLQQCADSIIRLRAEYLFSIKNFDAINFNFTSGDIASWNQWKQGYRAIVHGNKVRWIQQAKPDSSYQNFRKYLNIVFTYGGSYSLSRELNRVSNVNQMEIGDIFIQGGFPGHAVIVVDIAVDKKTEEKIFLLMQSYIPAQDIHILKNSTDSHLNPWYRVNFGETLKTPEWEFQKDNLMRF